MEAAQASAKSGQALWSGYYTPTLDLVNIPNVP